MHQLAGKPHLIYFLSIPMVILVGYYYDAEMGDINIHDTYIVFAVKHLCNLLGFLLGIIGLGYWLVYITKRRLINWMYWAHTGLTFGGILLVWGLTQWYSASIYDFHYKDQLTYSIIILFALTVAGQLLFPLNILIGLLKKNKK